MFLRNQHYQRQLRQWERRLAGIKKSLQSASPSWDLLFADQTLSFLRFQTQQLNDLLHARDLDVLEACLRLLLRPAQRHSAQRSARSIFTVSPDRLLALAHSWGNRELGLDLQQLAMDNVDIPEALTELNFQFYRTISITKPATADSATSVPSTAPDAASSSITSDYLVAPTPGKQRRASSSGASNTAATNNTATAIASEGVVVVHSANVKQLGATDYQILEHLIKEYRIPEEQQFQLLCRIRIATGISDPASRHRLLTIRILAIAVMSHVLSEAIVVEKFFVFEPEIIQSLTDLIHPDHKVPYVSDGCLHTRRASIHAVSILTLFSKSLESANCGTLCSRWLGSFEEQTAGRVDCNQRFREPRSSSLCSSKSSLGIGL